MYDCDSRREINQSIWWLSLIYVGGLSVWWWRRVVDRGNNEFDEDYGRRFVWWYPELYGSVERLSSLFDS